MLLCSCTSAINEYSSRRCYVVVDNSTFLDASLASAMTANSPGVFCMVQQTITGGAQQFSFTTNTGLSSKKTFTAKEQRMTLIFGLNNGVIVGYGTIGGSFYAYDRECPNCFDPDALPVKSKPLTMTDKGHAKCSVCGRVYDMNNRGYIISGQVSADDLPLTRFRASTSGPYGMLVVQ